MACGLESISCDNVWDAIEIADGLNNKGKDIKLAKTLDYNKSILNCKQTTNSKNKFRDHCELGVTIVFLKYGRCNSSKNSNCTISTEQLQKMSNIAQNLANESPTFLKTYRFPEKEKHQLLKESAYIEQFIKNQEIIENINKSLILL